MIALHWPKHLLLASALPAVALAAGTAGFVWLLPAVTGVGSGPHSNSTKVLDTPPITGPAAAVTPTLSPTPPTSSTPSTASSQAGALSPTSPVRSVKSAVKAQTFTETVIPAHFRLKKPGAVLPSGARCATAVRSVSIRENKAVNKIANHATGHRVSGASAPTTRVDGKFTGTTEQILRWAACKWGVDEDTVKAQAAVESWWHMDNKGDLGTDAARCPAGHGLGVDGTDGKCPESYGMMQVRYPYNKAAFPDVEKSTAMNVDYMYSVWRSCYEGQMTWLNTVERGSQYAAGDAWGCVGVWFSGRWHDARANGYITRVKDYRSQRIWTTRNFQQP
jgi:autotransporter family porin